MNDVQKLNDAHALSAEDVLGALGVRPDQGLTSAEAERRIGLYGQNRLRRIKQKSVWSIFLDQFRSIIVWLLAAAAGLSFYFHEFIQMAAILIVLAINAVIGFSTELKATRSMEALRRLADVRAKVRRNGIVTEIPAEQIAPGDILILDAGDIVTADLRLIEASNLQCDESSLTGESVPVVKVTDPVDKDRPISERRNIVYKGTAITSGSGAGVVIATGMSTELGRISALVESAEAEVSPLEKRLDRLAGQLVWATLVLTAFIAAIGIYAGRDLYLTLGTAIALAVAAVPEGLPIVATLALARGMWRMAQRNVLIEQLSAVETLGATTVILTDKTGTLTENRMSVEELILASGRINLDAATINEGSAFAISSEAPDPKTDQTLARALTVGALCNSASIPYSDNSKEGEGAVGDPMEVALLFAAKAAHIERPALLERYPEARREAFSAATNMMATFHRQEGGYLVAVKGAPEAVIDTSTQVLTPQGAEALDAAGRNEWQMRNNRAAGEGYRVLALAMKEVSALDAPPYEGLTLLGLACFLDPPRADVAGAIADCRRAGVRVVMVTGDHAETAKKVAAEVGLIDDEEPVVIALLGLDGLDQLPCDKRKQLFAASIFARVSPKTKLDLVALYQSEGEVVAMTGDGVNDAPALKKADIGVAMGRRGTQVAREAADMVLRDDAFSSIVAAIRQGRIIFGNIRAFVVYLLSCNLSEILVIGIATLTGLPLPLLPLQILFLNLVTDVFPAFALGAGEGHDSVMQRPPRDPKEPIIDRARWLGVGAYGGAITAATLAALWLALTLYDMSEARAVTVSFLTLAFAQLWHVFNMRHRESGIFRNEVTANPFIWGALALSAALIVAAVYAPGLSSVLSLSAPGADGWRLAIAMSLTPLLAGQLMKIWKSRAARPKRPRDY